MAGKPFLSHLGGRKGKYKLNKTSEANKENHMDGKYRQTSSGNGEPPQKKRRTEEEEGEIEGGDEFWDDSMEFTQADLEDLDIQASQAYTGTQKKPHDETSATFPLPSTSTTGHVTVQERSMTGTFRKPHLSRSSSSSVTSLNPGQQSNSSHNTSGRSSHTSNSSHSSYPSSLSDHYTSSSSLKSGSSSGSVSYPHQPSRSLSRGISSDSLDTTRLLGHNLSSLHHEDVNTIKQECAALKLQMERLREEICVKDGENKLLRDNLKTKDEELSTMKMEKVTQISQQHRQQSDKEKSLQGDLTRLQTQLQFKEQEEREMKSRCRELEAQLKSLNTGPSSSQSAPVSPKHLSPKPRRVPVEERSPKARSGFPTKHTFLSEEVSPRKPPHKTEFRGSQGFPVATGSKPKMDEKRMKMRLQTSRQQHLTGGQLVSRLLTTSPATTGSLAEKGIVGLLNTPTTPANLYSLQLDRDSNTTLLSPAKASLAAFQAAVNQSYEDGDMVNIVSADHFHLAIQGLTSLLTALPATDKSTTDHNSNNYTNPTSCNHTLLLSVAKPLRDTSLKNIGQSVLDSAVLILPLINDYLYRYIEMLDVALDTSNMSASVSSSSSLDSPDPSPDSPSGSLGMLIKTTVHFANDLESLALASLHTLSILLSCDRVCNVLLHPEEKETEEISCTATTPTASDFEPSTTDTGSLSPIPIKAILKLKLLQKVIRLANPGSKENKCNSRIVLTCLQILETLGTNASEIQMRSLVPILLDEGLQNCMVRDSEPLVVAHALGVLCVICKNNQIVSSLCTNTSGCVLLSMYTICLSEGCLENVAEPHRLDILAKIVNCVLCIASNHKGGLMVLLESDCQCSVEVVKTFVILLHTVMLSYKPVTCPEDDCVTMTTDCLSNHKLDILREGLLTLHLMCQFDPNFASRRLNVHHQYVQLICGLTNIYKHFPSDTRETEMSILQDLWDFDHDDSELSQDSDDDADHSDINMSVN